MEWPESLLPELVVTFHEPKKVVMEGDDTNAFVQFGPMLLRLPPPTVIIWCSATRLESYQNAISAAKRKSFHLELISTERNFDEELSEKCPAAIFIVDIHKERNFNGLEVMRRLESSKDLDETLIFSVIPAPEYELLSSSEKADVQRTCTKVFPVYPSIEDWCSELEFAQKAVLPLQAKLRSCSALFSALDHVDNAIEITDSSRLVQFVNTAFEHTTGCRKMEVIGTTSSELRRKSLPRDALCNIRHEREGSLTADQGLVDAVDWRCIHVSGPSSASPGQFVHIRQAAVVAKTFNALYSRRPSSKHQNPVDTPISEVLSLLTQIEQACSKNDELQKLVQKLAKVLNSTELYSPLAHFTSDDKVSSDLFGGLVLNGPLQVKSRSRKPSLSETMRLSINAHHPGSLRCTSPEVRAVLNLEPTWNFNIFELERLTYKRPLVSLASKIFQRCRVREFLQCSESCLRAWLDIIEAHYCPDNPYHNATHAADVLQATAYYLGKENIASRLEHAHAVAALIAAVIHDVGHPGKGTPFLINTGHQLSILYNDISVLENHHAALTFQVTLADPHINIFARLNRQDYNNMRKVIIDMVLATDMNKHFEYLAKFQQMASAEEEDRAPENSSGGITESQKTVCRMLIKCADISNPTRPFELCRDWAYRIVEEYFRQTAEERAKGLPLTMQVFDRDTCNLPLTQCSFMDMFVRDMFNSWTKFGEMPELMKILEDNYNRWQGEALTWTVGGSRRSEPPSAPSNAAEVRKGSEGSALLKSSSTGRSPLFGHKRGHRMSSPILPGFTPLSDQLNRSLNLNGLDSNQSAETDELLQPESANAAAE